MVLESIALIGLTLVFMVQVFNLGAWVIVKFEAHAAVDQGVRAGARVDVDGAAACDERARQVLGNLLAGPAGAGAALACGDDGEVVTAEVSLPLRSWLPGLPDSSTSVRALARKEGLR